jgi:hypothetical protein
MGQRANLIIATKDAYELYYNHWCANTLTEDLFWGAERAVEFIRKQKKVDEVDGWLDNIWAEGGCVVDEDKKVLLIFGGEDIMYDIPLRRIYLKLLAIVWDGWDIRWAYEGIADLADYVGYPRENVISEDKDRELDISFNPPEEKEWVSGICSIEADDNDIMIFPLGRNVEEYLIYGPVILRKIDKSIAYNKFQLSDWTSDFPTGGFHINLIERTIDFWSAFDSAGLLNSLQNEWTGWKINWNQDKYEKQIMASKNSINLQMPSLDTLLDRIKKILLRDSKDPVTSLLKVVDRIKEEGKDVKINPWALENTALDMSRCTREKILDEVIKRIIVI